MRMTNTQLELRRYRKVTVGSNPTHAASENLNQR
jgi:hypothetical protein